MTALLAMVTEALPAEEATHAVESYFETTYGPRLFLDEVSDQGLALLLRYRASTAAMALLECELHFLREPSPRLREFAERLGREASQTRDPGLAACSAYYEDIQRHGRVGAGFEQAVASLPATAETVAILGRSRTRYTEAVDLLMAAGRVEDAERFCRIHRDPGLAAAWAERRKDFRAALRWFREAKDLDSAMRCARATGDGKLVARVYEWQEDFGEALRAWRQLGQHREVARLLRKYPLLQV